MPTTLDTPVRDTMPAEIAEAQAAAHEAALELHEARSRRPKIDTLVEKIDTINRENGFSDMIRRAFGS